MKADRGALARAVAKPPAELRLLLLHGPDEAGSRAIADSYAAALGETERLDLGPQDLRSDPARLSDEAAAISMFGGRTLIRLFGIGEESLGAIEALLDGQAAGNPVVATAGVLRRDSKLLKLVERHPSALGYASYAPDAREFETLVGTMAREAGLAAPRDVIRRIADSASGDRAVAAGEVEKLVLFLDAAPDRVRNVELEHVTALSADISESDMDRLVNGVTAGRPGEVAEQLGRLRSEGAAGIMLLRAVMRRFYLLADLRSEVDQGSSAESVVATRGKAIFWKEKGVITAALAQWPAPRIATALSRLLAAERAIKSSGSAGDILAETALLDLARRAARLR
jgi:DNA polymerase-3 subunit delta